MATMVFFWIRFGRALGPFRGGPCRGLLLAFLLLGGFSQLGVAQSQLSIPAQFLRFLNPPGEGNGLLRPSCLTVDRDHGEILVGDAGNHRIVIFDTDGVYRFEFSGDEHFGHPIDLAVEPEGTILILGSTKSGTKLLRFDFDGLFLETVTIQGDFLDEVRHFDVDAKGRIYLLRKQTDLCEIAIHEADGKRLLAFPVVDDEENSALEELIVGDLRVRDDRIYLPISNEARVKVYGLNGSLLRVLGSMGSTPGKFAFPVAVDVAHDGTVLVLDKHRFNVLCFNKWGKFLGEFGGRGQSPGWFYFPSLLGVDLSDHVYIGQIFLNRVQVCSIPEVIRPRSSRDASPGASTSGSSNEALGLDGVDTGADAGRAGAETAADSAARQIEANFAASMSR